MTIELVLMILLLIFSAIFSGSESTLIATSLERVEVLIRRGVRGARLAYKYLLHPERLLVMILVGNNIVNVVFSSLFALYFKELLPETIIVLFSTVIVLIFGEMLPKSIFREFANRWFILITYLIQPIYWLLFPVTFILEKTAHFLIKLFRAHQRREIQFFTKKDLIVHFRQGSQQGLIENEKGLLIDKILSLSEQRVREVMVPRIDIVAVRKQATIEEVRQLFKMTRRSRILIYEDALEHVIGQIHVKDLFNHPATLTEIVRSVMVVPESRTTYDMLLDFKRTQTGIAVVIDEHGSVTGLVSVEDIVEELFGDIHDEHDPDRCFYKKISPDNYLLHGRLEIDFANEILQLRLPKGDYETIGGMLMTLSGRIPQKNEVFIIGGWRIRILAASNKSVRWVKLSPKIARFVADTVKD